MFVEEIPHRHRRDTQQFDHVMCAEHPQTQGPREYLHRGLVFDVEEIEWPARQEALDDRPDTLQEIAIARVILAFCRQALCDRERGPVHRARKRHCEARLAERPAHRWILQRQVAQTDRCQRLFRDVARAVPHARAPESFFELH